jgi:hypothetical protein
MGVAGGAGISGTLSSGSRGYYSECRAVAGIMPESRQPPPGTG